MSEVDESQEPETRPYLPGDMPPEDRRARMIRVDQAGEFGAKRIYEGQLAVLGHARSAPTIRHMAAQEESHLNAFNAIMVDRHVRPTLLSPVWHVAGYALGAATALMGERAAMVCTTAVEETIDDHYSRQTAALDDSDPELKNLIEKCHAEELEHRDTAYAHGARETPGYSVLSGMIKAGARAAIWLSKRV